MDNTATLTAFHIKSVIRIYWKVPVGGIDSWVPLTYPKLQYTFRERYEAYVILQLKRFFTNYLVLRSVISPRSQRWAHAFPSFMQLLTMAYGRSVALWVQTGCKLQYTGVWQFTTINTSICQLLDIHESAALDLKCTHVSGDNNSLALLTIYCLLLFWEALTEDQSKPAYNKFLLAKLICSVCC